MRALGKRRRGRKHRGKCSNGYWSHDWYPLNSHTAASDGLPRESCILIKLRLVLLHCRKKGPLRSDFWSPLLCRGSTYCASQPPKKLASLDFKFPSTFLATTPSRRRPRTRLQSAAARLP